MCRRMITLHHKLFDYKKVKQAIARLNTTNFDTDIILDYRLHFFLRLFSVLGSTKLPMKKSLASITLLTSNVALIA